MTTITLEQETMNYWQLLKGASDQVKRSLISLLSSSLVLREATAQAEQKHTRIRPEDLEITPFVASIGQQLNPLPADFDYDTAKNDYIMQKYG